MKMNSATSHDTVKPSSYLLMEDSEISEKVISLGRQLLSSFKNSDHDEITAWMINYVAELIIKAESGNEADKQSCFHAILNLWTNSSTFPDGSRPFENFEPILRTLESLSPENLIPRYINNYDEDGLDHGDTNSWVDLAKNLDVTARILIYFILDQAIESAMDDNTRKWLQTVSGIGELSELEIVVKKLTSNQENDDRKERIHQLESRSNQLRTFMNLCEITIYELEEELSMLKTS